MTIRELETAGKTYVPYTGENGLYVSRVLDKLGVTKLVNFVHSFKLCTMDEKDIRELHCTILYSPKPIRLEHGLSREDFHPVNLTCAAWVVRIELWPGVNEDGYLLAVLESKALQSIHRLWTVRGGVHTFKEYKPHISLKTPFDGYRGLTGRMKDANNHLAQEPILIRLENEKVEDIRPDLRIEDASVQQLYERGYDPRNRSLDD
jgi:hypothetical protein